MRKLSYILFSILFASNFCFSQMLSEISTDILNRPQKDVWPIKEKMTPHDTKSIVSSLHPSFYDRKDEWQTIIKKFWGPGESLSSKLATFDVYQNFARAYNATFLWNPINWDSLASSLRSQINDSTSRGEFSRILNDLAFGIKDAHARAMDSVMRTTPLNPGTPILADGTREITNFGAGLTPLGDSTLLVYKAVPNHPLGLVPGDIILGYQGVPWHQIVRELLQGGVPHALRMGGAPSADERTLLTAAGESWHLFDSIDVVKYSSGQIVHLPLDSMITLSVPSSYIDNEQLQIPGVPMPEFNWDSGAVTYGIIDGTNIGYIYVFHHAYFGVSYEFVLAVEALMETDGLIIDIRYDRGGQFGLNDGISRLMNYPTSTLDAMARCSPNDLFSICPSPEEWNGEIVNDIGTYYDRPIAVLLGPNCASYGDISAWQFSYVPYVRTFGRAPKAIYSSLHDQPISSGYDLWCTSETFIDHYNPNSIRWGQEYPLYEEVWLTPDGVANGEDDVVNRAVEWMNNLVFPHNIISEKGYYTAGLDTARIFSVIENPNSHQISARGYIKTIGGVLIDSADFAYQLLDPSGKLWVGSFDLPFADEFYDVSVTSIDSTIGEEFPVPKAVRFTTIPLIIDSIESAGISNFRYTIKPFLKNEGTNYTLEKLTVKLTSSDPWVTEIYPDQRGCTNLIPGQMAGITASFAVSYDSLTVPEYFKLKFEILSEGVSYWEMDTTIYVTPVNVELEDQIPLVFNLEQNYPNPFNPSTTIKYQIPAQDRNDNSNVLLKVYDILGSEVATLVNEKQKTGYYEVEFDGSNLTSGIYFYRINAGDYLETKKMILLK